MINDYKSLREIHCGNGTVAIAIDTTNTKIVIWEKEFTPVGTKYNNLNGKNIKECEPKSVILNFDGKDATKTIEILIEELQKVNNQLEQRGQTNEGKPMSEIEKMYENAGIKPYIYCSKPQLDCDARETGNCKKDCEYYSGERLLTPFTAEKQIAIENIIFQCNFGICELQRTMPAEFTKDNRFVKHYFSWEYHAGDIGYYDEITEEPYGDWDIEYSNPNREEALAGFVNALWDDHLTEEEKQQVKGILE